ncbi:MAG: hypothetical protein IJ514_00510 [Clostridia bacterium]|nr:hypothetical protein [Clostridia bacterium]
MKKTEEVFADIPKLAEGFRGLDNRIRAYHLVKGEKPPKEELIKEKEDLLTTARELEILDLKILFYIKNCSCIFRGTLCKKLHNLYRAERAYKELIQTDE